MSASNDADLARLMMHLIGLDLTSADGRAGSGAILREIEAKEHGALAMMQAGLALRRTIQLQ